MADVAATMKVLESDQQALLGGEPEIDDEQEEFVEIEDDDTASELDDDKPAAKVTAKPAAKPAAAKAPVVKPAAAAGAEDDSALPEPLRGKSRAEIAKMYSEAHQTIGRQGSELGEFRRKADMLIQASLASLQAAKKPAAAEPVAKVEEIDDSEFFANPKEAIRKAVENHPLVKQLKESQGNLAADQQRRTMEANAARFNAAHPDAGEVLKDPEFQAWVQKSVVRQGLLQRAHERYDFAAGDDVFSTWKELVAARKPVAAAAGDGTVAAATNPASEAGRTLAAAAKAKRAAAAAEAAAPTGGGGTAAVGKKKIYRRADILKLMETDQERYAAMADEIALAYAEKRVR